MTRASRLLIANRGEIAVRIARAAADLGMTSVCAFSEDDANAPHLAAAQASIALPGRGAGSYLDVAAVIKAARDSGCDAVHPGYGFLSESAAFAEACAAAGLLFVGPSPDTLRLFGDKAAARQLARELDVPLLAGTAEPVSLAQARDFLASLGLGGAMMLKAVSGGGGRGMRVVARAEDLDEAYAICAAEARKAFGDDRLYAEQFVPRARHIEIQVVGDGSGAVVHLGERECTLQRRNQKLVEVSPSPGLAPDLRKSLCDAACRMAARVAYSGLGTFEFLVDADDPANHWFIEANPRIQVEHTVTEEVTGIDLVRSQILIAAGASLESLGLSQDRIAWRGAALQLRVNAERIGADGTIRPSAGLVTLYEMPSGAGVRIDGYMRSGFALNPNYDTLLSKIIVSDRSAAGLAGYRALLDKARRALAESRVGGIATNMSLLAAIVGAPEVRDDAIHTRFVEDAAERLLAEAASIERAALDLQPAEPGSASEVDRPRPVPAGMIAAPAPMAGALTALKVAAGDTVRKGQLLAIVEAMKMEQAVVAPCRAVVAEVLLAEGALVSEGDPLLFLEPAVDADEDDGEAASLDFDAIPPLLADEIARKRLRMDEARPKAVAGRRRHSRRTLRENIGTLCDPESFVEYGGLALPSQRQRRSREELVAMGPADGFVTGIGSINGGLFPGEASECFVMGYDYTAFAGTQGWANHKKLGRMLGIASRQPKPIVVFTEGGGGRPGETDQMRASGLDTRNFADFARLSGKVPLIGLVSGRCFAGNAALLGCCDVIIATPDATIGMGGPAMIEGGGLGIYSAEEVGPASVQVANGVIDILAPDEGEALAAAKKYLSFFQGRVDGWSGADQRAMRHLVPENRQRTYDIRKIIETLADTGSPLELRPDFGRGLITTLARIEGRPVGIIANDTRHLAGALHSVGSDKAARFLRLCDLFGLPVVSLCDTPGFMVGPESEKTGAVRHMSRMFLAGANLTVPIVTVVLRNGFGLGAMAMAGGSMHETALTVAWPTAQFGAMGIEGAVKLGYRRELEELTDPAERQALFDSLVARLVEEGKPHNAASFVEIDDVIDPADTRRLISRTLGQRASDRRASTFLDSW